jgi:hypothetical protein
MFQRRFLFSLVLLWGCAPPSPPPEADILTAVKQSEQVAYCQKLGLIPAVKLMGQTFKGTQGIVDVRVSYAGPGKSLRSSAARLGFCLAEGTPYQGRFVFQQGKWVAPQRLVVRMEVKDFEKLTGQRPAGKLPTPPPQ